MRLMLITNLDAGHLTYSNFGLQHMVTGLSTIQRTTYSVAGQSVAVKVAGDTDNGNNGLFFLYSDHLGSTSAMRHPNGSVTQTKYLPFGGYRGGSGGNPITDRGYTGHKHNDSLGLIYMNARYYVVGISRFASADSIIPNPTNPQSYNRYSYTRNNPLNFTDPTGHRECGAYDGCSGEALPPLPRPTPRETKAGIPALIQEATPFDMLPFNLLDEDGNPVYDGSTVNGFGDTTYASTSGLYGTFGYLHPGVDIPLSEGTELLALGTGTVHCGADSKQGACGQLSTSGGHGIGIKYDACSCIVWYVHAIEVTLNYGDPVKAGDVVGVVGADSRGYRHLHLEIRNPENNMVYNPIYFFQPDTWNSINLQYQPYRNSYANPETRVYAIMMSTGFDYWNWEGTYPFVFVR